MPLQSYRELTVWQKSLTLVVDVYKLTESFPREELYGLTSQMRRAAVSIPSNIAESRRRGSRLDFRHFLLTSLGSGAELETQLEIVKRLPFGRTLKLEIIEATRDEVMRMLNRMIAALQAKS